MDISTVLLLLRDINWAVHQSESTCRPLHAYIFTRMCNHWCFIHFLSHICTERRTRPHSTAQSKSLTRAGERDETTAAAQLTNQRWGWRFGVPLFNRTPNCLPLSRSLLLVEAIISSPRVSLADLALPIFFFSYRHFKVGDVESRFWPCMACRRWRPVMVWHKQLTHRGKVKVVVPEDGDSDFSDLYGDPSVFKNSSSFRIFLIQTIHIRFRNRSLFFCRSVLWCE